MGQEEYREEKSGTKKCKRCGKEFISVVKIAITNPRNPLKTWATKEYKLCLDCRGAIGKTETDCTTYVKKGAGYRLIAGFGLIHSNE